MDLKELKMSKDINEHTFGQYLREKRETLGKSVRGFAEELGMTAAYLSDIEKETDMLRGNTLISLLRHLEYQKRRRKFLRIWLQLPGGTHMKISIRFWGDSLWPGRLFENLKRPEYRKTSATNCGLLL